MRRAHLHALCQPLSVEGCFGGVDLLDCAADDVVVIGVVLGHGATNSLLPLSPCDPELAPKRPCRLVCKPAKGAPWRKQFALPSDARDLRALPGRRAGAEGRIAPHQTPSPSSCPSRSARRRRTRASTRPTAKLFEIADTPEKMLALGEEGPSIGAPIQRPSACSATRRRDVIKLSRLLVEEYGGEVPSSRAALQSLPDVGRKTANVVLNMWWRFPAQAVDQSTPTHIFRLGNRAGIAPGKDVDAVERAIEETNVPAEYQLQRPSLDDPCTAATSAWRANPKAGACLIRRPVPVRGQECMTKTYDPRRDRQCHRRRDCPWPTTVSSTTWGSRRASCS